MCATQAVDWQKSNSCPNEGSVELHFLPASVRGRSSSTQGSHQFEQHCAQRRIAPITQRGMSQLYIHCTDVVLFQTHKIRAPAYRKWGLIHGDCRKDNLIVFQLKNRTGSRATSSSSRDVEAFLKASRNKQNTVHCWGSSKTADNVGFISYCSKRRVTL